MIARWVGRLSSRHVAQQLPQHVAEAEHGIDLQPVGFAVQRRQRVIGAENVGGTVDQKDMVALLQGLDGSGLGGGFGGCFRHGRNLGIFARGMTALGEGILGEPHTQLRRPGAATGYDNYSAACSAGSAFFGAIQNASGRSNRKLACSASASRQIASAPATPTMVTISEIVPMSRDQPAAQQQRPGRRHRQEEGEIDDDGMLAAITQEVEPVRPCQQRAGHDDGAGAGQPQCQ